MLFQVRSNWKKLTSGRLEGISDDYMQHLKSFGPQLIQGPPISSAAYHELTQSILDAHQRSLAPPKPAAKGTFGRIYSEYKSRLEASKAGFIFGRVFWVFFGPPLATMS